MKPFAFLACTWLAFSTNLACAGGESKDYEVIVKEAVRKLHDSNPFVRIRGTGMILDSPLANRQFGEVIVPEMIRVLDDPEETVRRNALWILAPLADRLKGMIDKIAAGLNDPSARVRENAA